MALPGIQGSKPQYVYTVHNSLTRKVWHSVSQQGVGTHLLPLLTPSSGHHNMYGWQVGGGYPTGMLSCLIETSPHIHVFRSASDTVGPAAAPARAPPADGPPPTSADRHSRHRRGHSAGTENVLKYRINQSLCCIIGSTNPCRITRKEFLMKQTKMYVCTLEEFILVDVVTLLYMDELKSIGNAVVYIQSQQWMRKDEINS